MAGALNRKAAHPRAACYRIAEKLLLAGRFFLVEAGFYRCPDAGQHVLGGLSVRSGRSQFQILVEGLRGAVGSDHLVALEAGFTDHVDTLPIVRVGLGRVGGDDLVKSHDCVIDFAGVGQHCADIEVVLSCAGGVQLRGFIVVRDRVINLARLGVGLGQIVVVGGKLLTCVLLFGVGMGGLQINGFLIGVDGLLIAVLFLSRVGLLVGRHAICVA